MGRQKCPSSLPKFTVAPRSAAQLERRGGRGPRGDIMVSGHRAPSPVSPSRGVAGWRPAHPTERLWLLPDFSDWLEITSGT